jgi:phospholipid/cholesterol/gamma-HCH transport system substrate-binding protein
MAKQANRMMIGGFVILAVIIMAASLVIFGSGKFFRPTVKCVMYFDGSVKGLNVGAPVLFQGVQIGSVTSIILEVDPTNLQPQIPVIIEYEPDKFQVAGGSQKLPRDPRKNIPKLIERGLRAVLGMQSFITGQLDIELGFYPTSTVCYAQARTDKVYKDYIVIPTCQSTTQKLADALEKLDLAALEKHLESAMDGISILVNNPDLAASIRSLKATLQDTNKLVKKLDAKVDPLAKNANKTVNDIGTLARNLDSRVGGLSTSLNKTLSDARGSISPDSPLMVNLENTLQELSAMSRSFRQLADYLDQQPQSVIFGKKKPGGKQ